MVMMSGNITVRFRDTVLLDQATAGTPVELTFGWVTDYAARSLIFKAHAVIPASRQDAGDRPNGVQATFAWQAAPRRDPGRTRPAMVAPTTSPAATEDARWC